MRLTQLLLCPRLARPRAPPLPLQVESASRHLGGQLVKKLLLVLHAEEGSCVDSPSRRMARKRDGTRRGYWEAPPLLHQLHRHLVGPAPPTTESNSHRRGPRRRRSSEKFGLPRRPLRDPHGSWCSPSDSRTHESNCASLV